MKKVTVELILNRKVYSYVSKIELNIEGEHSTIISAIKSFDKNSRIFVSFLGMHMGNFSASLIDYASDFKIMRFGVVGVKVWFNQRQFTPIYYMFKFVMDESKSVSKKHFIMSSSKIVSRRNEKKN